MVTAIDPDFDIIEMRVDDYLVKPSPVTSYGGRRPAVQYSGYNDRLLFESKGERRDVLRVEKTDGNCRTANGIGHSKTRFRNYLVERESLADELDVEEGDLSCKLVLSLHDIAERVLAVAGPAGPLRARRRPADAPGVTVRSRVSSGRRRWAVSYPVRASGSGLPFR